MHDTRPSTPATAPTGSPPSMPCEDWRSSSWPSIHTRDFFLLGTDMDPLTDPNVSVIVFATRWITHFCAPVFVLLAGTSAGLMATRKSSSPNWWLSYV